jgi:3-oxoacyl-[acyl-carrier protein] reductase
MDFSLAGKVVLVTGASTGIGAAVATAFGQQRARVAVHYNSSEEAAHGVAAAVTAAGGEALALRGDVRQPDDVRTLVERAIGHFGRLDILVNNAGALVRRSLVADLTDDLLDEVLALNVQSVVTGCRAVVPQFRRQGGGCIINVTSIAARNGGGPGSSIYAGAKGFVSTFTRGLARELAPEKIRVNGIAPGVIQTPFHERFSTPQQLAGLQATIPMNRLGTAEECVGAFLYLASDTLSGYVTGQVIEVNGGQLMP